MSEAIPAAGGGAETAEAMGPHWAPDPRLARRIDPQVGLAEEARFLEIRDGALFSVLHAPVGPSRMGVVVCCPILVEHLTNYRNEVLQARALAASGVAVQRFHYRGTGHSSGDDATMSFESMVDDALSAADHLMASTGVERIGFMGTRWGGLVAVHAAARFENAPLVLWAPVVDASRYFRELIRGRLVRRLKDERFGDERPGEWMHEFDQQGWVDILGFPLYHTFYTAARGYRLDTALATAGGPVLLVQFGRGTTLRPEYAALKSVLVAQDRVMDHEIIAEEPAWLFPGHRLTPTLIKITTDWLVRVAVA